MIKKTKTENKKKDEKVMPVAKFRSGALQAAIWSNEIEKDNEKFEAFSFTLERSYKDKEDEWQKTNLMRKRDVANLYALMNKILEYLYIDEDEEKEV